MIPITSFSAGSAARCIRFHPHLPQVAVIHDKSNTISVWDYAVPLPELILSIGRPSTRPDSRAMSAAYSQDGNWVAGSFSVGPVQICDCRTGLVVGSIGHMDGHGPVCFTIDSNRIITSAVSLGSPGASGAELWTIGQQYMASRFGGSYNDLAMHPTGLCIAASMNNQGGATVVFAEVAPSGLHLRNRGYFSSLQYLQGVAFNPSGSILCLAGSIDTNGVELLSFPECSQRFALLFEPGTSSSEVDDEFNGRSICLSDVGIFCGFASGTIGLYCSSTGTLLDRWRFMASPISSIDLNHTGDMIAIGYQDGTVQIARLVSTSIVDPGIAHQFLNETRRVYERSQIDLVYTETFSPLVEQPL